MGNRLENEVSPYLRQHAHNPVDWYPWGEEAIERARREDKPILLSIGYSACHWCHVMERESFDDEATAALMNERFVSVKVDREERPDLDQIYQLTVQLMGRSGGWPLTVFLTPELKPYFAGTYFPPVERYGMPSFQTVLRAVHQAYDERREEVEQSAEQITGAIAQVTSPRGEKGDPPRDFLEQAAQKLARRFDEVHGGFGDRPKFPNTMALEVLLRAHHRHGDEAALAQVIRALEGMRDGGIWDQLGGGFHRYSTDERWLVPHFEKMLYDNALLARLYADAFRATGDARWADVARDTMKYVVREMRSKEGGFYSSQDADSEGEEGKFFVWTPEELAKLLTENEARAASLHFGVAPGGNFEHTGASVLHVSRPLATVGKQMELGEDEVRALVEAARTKLFAARESRPKPFRDEKIIASWNGLMIGAMADVGAALGDGELVALAADSLRFVREKLFASGSLLRIYKDGEARIDAFLEDHGDVASAALDVYEATMDGAALDFARALVDRAIERFWDAEDGGFFFAPADAKDLIVRAKDAYDNAVPSGTSSICHALLRLHALTGEERYLTHAEEQIRLLAEHAMEQPMGFGHLLGAIDRYVHGATQVLVVARAGDPEGEALLDAARRAYTPNRVLARVDPDAEDPGPAAALLEGQRMKDGRATAYVCRDRTCSAPITDPAALRGAT